MAGKILKPLDEMNSFKKVYIVPSQGFGCFRGCAMLIFPNEINLWTVLVLTGKYLIWGDISLGGLDTLH